MSVSIKGWMSTDMISLANNYYVYFPNSCLLFVLENYFPASPEWCTNGWLISRSYNYLEPMFDNKIILICQTAASIFEPLYSHGQPYGPCQRFTIIESIVMLQTSLLYLRDQKLLSGHQKVLIFKCSHSVALVSAIFSLASAIC